MERVNSHLHSGPFQIHNCVFACESAVAVC